MCLSPSVNDSCWALERQVVSSPQHVNELLKGGPAHGNGVEPLYAWSSPQPGLATASTCVPAACMVTVVING